MLYLLLWFVLNERVYIIGTTITEPKEKPYSQDIYSSTTQYSYTDGCDFKLLV